jgi:PAS domain S-box-containing protein
VQQAVSAIDDREPAKPKPQAGQVRHAHRQPAALVLTHRRLIAAAAIPVTVAAAALIAFGRSDQFLNASSSGAVLASLVVVVAAVCGWAALDAIERRRRSEEKLQLRDEMLNNVIDHAPQGVAVIQPDLTITNANPRLAAMLCSPAETLVGTRLDSFLPLDYLRLVLASIASADSEPTYSYESDSQARRADGSTFWMHWSCTPIRTRDESIDYYLATFEDVTSKREAEETAVANLAQLEKLNRLKSEFVAMVSHEFRTALVGIQGFSELIKDQDMEAREVKQLATEIYNDAIRLSRMITEMLDFDRLEAGKVRLDLKSLDINELAREAVERARVMSRKSAITAQLADGLPDVLGDADRLLQVMTNLLSNAVKYSPTGAEIGVTTRLLGSAVEVTIWDHGRGIPPEFIKRLFGKYERYEDNHAGKIIGTGLGLAISRQIVEMHGGRIMVDSVIGRGSEFRFTIPVAVQSVGQAANG